MFRWTFPVLLATARGLAEMRRAFGFNAEITDLPASEFLGPWEFLGNLGSEIFSMWILTGLWKATFLRISRQLGTPALKTPKLGLDCIYIYIYMYLCICVYVYLSLSLCVYIYIYIYICFCCWVARPRLVQKGCFCSRAPVPRTFALNAEMTDLWRTIYHHYYSYYSYYYDYYYYY